MTRADYAGACIEDKSVDIVEQSGDFGRLNYTFEATNGGLGFDLIATEDTGYDGTNSYAEQRALLCSTQNSKATQRGASEAFWLSR